MQKIASKIPFNYKTIKVTQSRLNKGLLAIPVSLIDYFPKQKGKIYIAMGTSDKISTKIFVVNHIIDKIPKKFEKEVHFEI